MALIFVLIACIWSMGQRKRVIAIGCVLLVPAAAAAWVKDESFGPQLAVVGLICALAFLAFTAMTLLVNILRQRNVVLDTILGGVCVYLLIAVIWALLYEIMERIEPGSFGPWPTPTGALSLKRLVTPDLIYYSVFTISTISGRGVRPMSGAARVDGHRGDGGPALSGGADRTAGLASRGAGRLVAARADASRPLPAWRHSRLRLPPGRFGLG